jgi:hypothetical protein
MRIVESLGGGLSITSTPRQGTTIDLWVPAASICFKSYRGRPARNMTMEISALCAKYVSAVRKFVAPSYRPELHYMSGPGPAYARREILVESKRVLPLLRNPLR